MQFTTRYPDSLETLGIPRGCHPIPAKTLTMARRQSLACWNERDRLMLQAFDPE
ncbi:MAG: hypothetical protein HC827_02320 [Cyanobacteria bacterium RM1_2_2]|nr:hypothetical protein [Cyanobacteria bacterium RM1_2_2]